MYREYLEPTSAKGAFKASKRFNNPNSLLMKRFVLPRFAKTMTGRINHLIYNIKSLYKAGATMGCGNDGNGMFVFPGAMGFEMYLNEIIGIKAADVIKMATINNARLLGMENEIGSVEVGKIADIAVFGKNPLETTRNLFNPTMVFQGGKLVYKV